MLASPVGPLSREVISIQMGRGVSRIVEDCFDHLCLTVSGLPIPSSVHKLKKEAGGAKEAPTQEHAIDSTATHFILHFIRLRKMDIEEFRQASQQPSQLKQINFARPSIGQRSPCLGSYWSFGESSLWSFPGLS